MPVHSSAMSTPIALCGSSAGFAIGGHLDRAAADVDRVALDRHVVPGSVPCTLSKRSRWALVSTGPRSLMATTSMSLRPRLDDGAQHVAADAAKSVDCDFHGHDLILAEVEWWTGNR